MCWLVMYDVPMKGIYSFPAGLAVEDSKGVNCHENKDSSAHKSGKHTLESSTANMARPGTRVQPTHKKKRTRERENNNNTRKQCFNTVINRNIKGEERNTNNNNNFLVT